MASEPTDRARLLACVRALAPELAALIPDLDAIPMDRLRALHASIASEAALYAAAGMRRMDEGGEGAAEAHPA